MTHKTSSVLCLLVILLTILSIIRPSYQLDNGLALKPPMGWISWVRYTCTINCTAYPKGCVNEDLYKEAADAMVNQGFKDVGYEFINIDDCWSEWERDPTTGRLVPDRKRFPSGLGHLSDYIHSKGLKFGLYSDIGTKTCEGYPGHLNGNGSNYFSLDAQTFVEWKIDSLKVDGCYANAKDMDNLYPELGKALNKTGRPILYTCSWPFYVREAKMHPNYTAVSHHCNTWRIWYDVHDVWSNVLGIIDYFAANQEEFSNYHGPGHFFDPDMIVIGGYGLSIEQSKSQFALWSMMSAPLLMSNDLRTLRPEFKEILLNRHVISVDQDPLGHFGKRVIIYQNVWGNAEVWAKKLSEGDFAVVYFNRQEGGNPYILSYKIETILEKILLPEDKLADRYDVKDLFAEGKLLGTLSPSNNLTLQVNRQGVRMVRLVPIPS